MRTRDVHGCLFNPSRGHRLGMEGGPVWYGTRPISLRPKAACRSTTNCTKSGSWTITKSRSIAGRCPAATHAHEDDNPLCGDVVRVELAIDPDGTVREAYFNGDGCCISQAAASMLIERIDGRPVEEVKRSRPRTCSNCSAPS